MSSGTPSSPSRANGTSPAGATWPRSCGPPRGGGSGVLSGPGLMVQVENEYASCGNDRDYMFALKGFWDKAGIEVPLFTADGATPHMLEAGSLPGAAIGLDTGTNEKQF